ncbi:MAG TPA: hypothetical protein IAB64_04990 [Candidatus Coproplasma excrementavium]|nr:hypothetical protein [Candidatus Coproplasma excrementavium]
MESVILATPTLWILYLIALVLCAGGLINRAWYILDFVSLALAVGASAYALLLGASLGEVAAALMLFLAIGLMTFVPFGIKKKPDNNARHKESMDGTGDKKK